jgi:hypothetical protein
MINGCFTSGLQLNVRLARRCRNPHGGRPQLHGSSSSDSAWNVLFM